MLAPGRRPLVTLTTNPGATLPIQRRSEIDAGRSVVDAKDSYAAAAGAFAAYYARELKGPARRRIEALRRLALLAGYEGVLQVECIPFHSPKLAGKHSLLQRIGDDPLLACYFEALRSYLPHHAVVAVSAVSTRESLGPNILKRSKWLGWQADLLGIDAADMEFLPLVSKGTSVTCAALLAKQGVAPKALVLMMGSNQLPAEDGLRRLAGALTERALVNATHPARA